MTTTDPTAADVPAVPARVRTVTYFVLLGVSALVLLTTGLAPLWLDDPTATRLVASAGVLSGVAGLLAGGLGVTYRPTR
jgi:hypothetical protein